MAKHKYNPYNLQDREFFDSKYRNDRTYMAFYERLVSLAISMWKWENLPDTINKRFLETRLFSRGAVVFFKDPDLGFLTLPFTNEATLDIYSNPSTVRAYSNTGYSKVLTADDSVIIWNSELRMPMQPIVEAYAYRLANIQRTIDVNVNAQKTPILISCPEEMRLSLLNVYKNYQGNEPVIYGDRSLSPDDLKVINTEAPYHGKDLSELMTQIWNEALSYLGISNVNIVKRERLLSDEIVRNQGGIIAQRYSRLNPRLDAVERINKMFGLDIKVGFQSDLTVKDFEDATVDVTQTDNRNEESEDKIYE